MDRTVRQRVARLNLTIATAAAAMSAIPNPGFRPSCARHDERENCNARFQDAGLPLSSSRLTLVNHCDEIMAETRFGCQRMCACPQATSPSDLKCGQ
jgi:hypothetical protein